MYALKKIKLFKYKFKFKQNIDSNACSNSPCLNGATCTITGTGSTYTCTCVSGYTGNNCQICNFNKIFFFQSNK